MNNTSNTKPKSLFDPVVKLAKVDGMYKMANVYPNLSRTIFTDADKVELIGIIRNSATVKGFVKLNAGIMAKRYKLKTTDIQRWMRNYKNQSKSSENTYLIIIFHPTFF